MSLALLQDSRRAASVLTSQTYAFPYNTREANARYVFVSNTTSITVRAINDTLTNSLLQTPGGFHAIGLRIDGVNYSAGFQLGSASGDIGNQIDVTLTGWAAGSHTFELTDGARYILTGTKRGTPITQITVDRGAAFALQAPVPPAKRIVVTGDSFSSGQVITTAGLCGPYVAWPMVMRANILGSVSGSWGGAHVINDSLAGWRWQDIANDGTSVAALTAQCDGTGSNLWVVFLGVNDYLQGVSSANFTNDVTTLLDLFHTAVPGASVAVCLMPIWTATLNGAGLNPAGYNSIMSTAVSTRTAFASTIDLSATLTYPGDGASDGIHPNSGGTVKLEAAIRTALGY